MTEQSKPCCGGCTTDASTNLEPTSPAPTSGNTWASTFSVPKMDCPSEERMIRMALEGAEGIHTLKFDLPNRELLIIHEGPVSPLSARLVPLGFGATVKASAPIVTPSPLASDTTDAQEAGTLKILLAINATMFIVELLFGLLAQSTGLIADSLDMFADAAVYGLALYAVGKSAKLKLKAAHISGWLQAALAIGALTEVIRRFVWGSEPESGLMMGIAGMALVANVTCLWLISRHRDGGVHMKASWIFSSNDVIANVGVLAAGGLVALTHSPYPDLAIGAIIGLVVLYGARRILALRM